MSKKSTAVESPDDPLSLKAASRKMGVSAKTVYRLCLAGSISHIKITPTLWRVRRGVVDIFMAKREAKGSVA